jgi:hypothetical protein
MNPRLGGEKPGSTADLWHANSISYLKYKNQKYEYCLFLDITDKWL